MSLADRIKHSWNAFIGRDPTNLQNVDTGPGYYARPDRVVLTRGNERSIINAAITRMAVDCAQTEILHVNVDEEGQYKETRTDSKLNYCLTKSANIDQTGRAFRQDIFMRMFDEGVAAVVPIDTDLDPSKTLAFEPSSLRVASVKEWYPKHVKVEVYDDRDGKTKEVLVEKRWTSIIENPFRSVMNEKNSILQRLIRKLNLLDVIDDQSGSGKLDMIIQLPYTVKSDLAKERAEDRRRSIEQQLAENKYGIAYIDSTEHITQLNRSVENKLMGQVEYLMNLFFSQLGITQGVLDGTADDNTMNNYYCRTLEPPLTETVSEMERKLLTKTAVSQGQAIRFFRNPFKMVPISQLPDLADKLTRNEIMTSNEFRPIIGLKPSDDPNANELRNKNISAPNKEAPMQIPENQNGGSFTPDELRAQLEQLDELDSQLDELEKMAGGNK